MEATQITIKGRLIGAAEVKDFTSGLRTGQTQMCIRDSIEDIENLPKEKREPTIKALRILLKQIK